jgi:two-component system, NarL family, response regulator DevR
LRHEESSIVPKTVNILIADDHAVVRQGLKTLLERQGSFKVVAEAASGEQAILMAQQSHPDVAILDIRMPGLSGIEACRQIVNSVEGCKVIMLTSYAEDEILFAAIQAGASGYVLKLVSGNDLIHAIERVSSGEGSLDPSAIASAFGDIRKAAEARHSAKFSTLTSQETAVLALLPKGMTNRQIAGTLNLGEGTIRNYVSSILAKLGVANRTEAAAFAVKNSIDETCDPLSPASNSALGS